MQIGIWVGSLIRTRKRHDFASLAIVEQKDRRGALSTLPLDEDPYADWSCHLFTADRTQYIIVSNTKSLYSCVMYGRGITNDSVFIERALSTIREFMEDDGQSSTTSEHVFRGLDLLSLCPIGNNKSGLSATVCDAFAASTSVRVGARKSPTRCGLPIVHHLIESHALPIGIDKQ